MPKLEDGDAGAQVSVLTPEERAFLEAHTRRIEAKRAQHQAHALHEAARKAGRVPDVSLATYRHNRGLAQERQAQARAHLAVCFSPAAPRAQRLEAARAAVDALPRQLEAWARAAPPKAFQRKASRSVADVAQAVKAALEAGHVGPRAARGNAAQYVQEEDLSDVIPDGWGASWPIEATRLGRRAGVPPLAVPLLSLLTWTSSLREARPGDVRACGAGFQVSIEWLARKLGCSASWVKVLLNRMDPFAAWRRDCAAVRKANARRRREGAELLAEPPRPRGTPLVHRYRRLVRYADTPQRDGARAACWVDARGRPHFWADVRGVCYLTDAGRGLLVRRAHREGPASQRPIGFLLDLSRKALGLRWRLSARLRRGSLEKHRPGEAATPAG